VPSVSAQQGAALEQIERPLFDYSGQWFATNDCAPKMAVDLWPLLVADMLD
jgi:hypothetical protein